MITLKSAREIETMRRSGKITSAVLASLLRAARPGMTLREIDRLAEKAEADGDLSTAVRAITATLKSMETLFGKVTGLISDSPTIDASTKVIAVLSSLSEQQLRAFLAGGKDVMALRAE